jgi:dolichol-phosphate mannosyltransferase
MKYMVIIPNYNEIKNIPVLIQNVLSLADDYHILVVDDNSPDGTARVVEEMQKENSRIHLIVRKSKMGLGSAYIEGFRYALKNGADYIRDGCRSFSRL